MRWNAQHHRSHERFDLLQTAERHRRDNWHSISVRQIRRVYVRLTGNVKKGVSLILLHHCSVVARACVFFELECQQFRHEAWNVESSATVVFQILSRRHTSVNGCGIWKAVRTCSSTQRGVDHTCRILRQPYSGTCPLKAKH